MKKHTGRHKGKGLCKKFMNKKRAKILYFVISKQKERTVAHGNKSSKKTDTL